jgi:ABC-type polysaccharide/polyol phosphate export permease
MVTQAYTELSMSGDPKLRFGSAITDLGRGLRAWPFWTLVGWYDIKQRYRRTTLGPLWITASMGILTGMLGLIYGSIFHLPLANYLLYLAAGMVCWYFVSSTIMEGTTVFIAADGIIKQGAIPLSIHVYRVVWRNLIVLVHNAVVLAVVFLLFRSVTLLNPLLILVGIVLLVMNLTVIVLVLGLVSTRFRDLPPLMANIMQVLFYITPILYQPSQLPASMRLIAYYNPFYHVIEVLRRPLIGEIPPIESYVGAIASLVIGGALALVLFQRFRGRIAYWL